MSLTRKCSLAAAGIFPLAALAACHHDTASTDAAMADAALGADAALVPDAVSGIDNAQEAGACPSALPRTGPFARLRVENAPRGMGLTDPSVEYLPSRGIWLMAYTAVVPSPLYQHLSLAVSSDRGATWSYLGDVTPVPPEVTITTSDLEVCGATRCTGTLGQETPALLIDDSDPDPSRRLKVFAHAYYFDYVGDRQMDIGYLALYTASVPEGPWTETKLFGWPSSSPLSNQGVVHDIAADGSLGLADCVIVGEPAALMRPQGIIDLAISCPKGTTDIRLLRSLDHGRTWTFVSTLLTAADGPLLGSESRDITGADLFYADGAYHLSASPFGTIRGPGDGTFSGYHGCVVVRIADMDAGQVARCRGVPVVEASYFGLPGQFMGACSAAEGLTASGVLLPVPDLSLIKPGEDLPPGTEVWQLFGSGTVP